MLLLRARRLGMMEGQHALLVRDPLANRLDLRLLGTSCGLQLELVSLLYLCSPAASTGSATTRRPSLAGEATSVPWLWKRVRLTHCECQSATATPLRRDH